MTSRPKVSRQKSSTRSIEAHLGNDEIQVLCCTANMGNAEPKMSCIEAWVPEDGLKSMVTPLKNGAFRAMAKKRTFGKHMLKRVQEETVEKENPEVQASSEEASASNDCDNDYVWEDENVGFDECNEISECENNPTLSENYFHVIAIGMQEATWREEDNASPYEINRLNSLRDNLGQEDVKSKESFLYRIIPERFKADSLKLKKMFGSRLPSYILLSEQQRGQMRLFIYVHRSVAPLVTLKVSSAVNTGLGGVYHNKGGIVTTLELRKTRISFISAHLAAHEGETYYKARCNSTKSILSGSHLSARHLKDYDVSISSHHCFFMGDLNFRTENSKDLPQKEFVKQVVEMVEAKKWSELNSADELQKALRMKHCLVGFHTLFCDFSPTFKMKREPGFVYKDQRIPSYTDRILFKSSSGLSKNLTVHGYEPCEDYISSDHKPIRGAFSIITNQNKKSILTCGNFSVTFQQMKCLLTIPSSEKESPANIYLKISTDPYYLLKNVGKSSKSISLSSWFCCDETPMCFTSTRQLKEEADWENEVLEVHFSINRAKQLAGSMLFFSAVDAEDDRVIGTVELNITSDILLVDDTQDFLLPLLDNGLKVGDLSFTHDGVRKTIKNLSDIVDISKFEKKNKFSNLVGSFRNTLS